MTTTLLRDWRPEIAAEIEQLEAELAPLRAELATAERSIARLQAAQKQLEEAIARGPAPFSQGVALCVFGRLLDERERVRREISRLRGGLPARIAALEEQVADRRLGLSQLDRALAEPDAHPRLIAPANRRRRAPQASPFRLESRA